jgi:hypothetical protein
MAAQDFLTITDKKHLESLVADGVEESLTLDYKASAALGRESEQVNELWKDVTAMANSDGGQLIYGIEEDRKKGKPMRVDDGVVDPKISREWIYQILNSKVRPRLEGVEVERIPLDDAKTKFAFVITVPQTQTGPHQGPQHKYYRRAGIESIPMEDYEVRDVMGRAKHPSLSAHFTFTNGSVRQEITFNQGRKTETDDFPVWVILQNSAVQPAMYIVCKLFFDTRLLRVGSVGNIFRAVPGNEIEFEGLSARAYSANLSPINTFPVFKENPLRIAEVTFCIPRLDDMEGVRYVFGYDLRTPGFSTRQIGFIYVRRGKLELPTEWTSQPTDGSA